MKIIALRFTQVMLIIAACFLENLEGGNLITQLGHSRAQKCKRSVPGSLSLVSVRPLGILSRLTYSIRKSDTKCLVVWSFFF